MISPEDREKYRKISEQIFLNNIKTYPLIGKIRQWIQCFMQEIEELKERIKKLEAEIELLKRSRTDLDQTKTEKNSPSNSEDTERKILLTPALIAEIRLSFGCNAEEMAKLLEMSPKVYGALERGNYLPSFEQETRILRFRYMKATERREILQKNGIFVKSVKSINLCRIPKPPETPEIRFPIAKLHEILEKLQISRTILAQMLGVSRHVVANWFYEKVQPSEENCKKLNELLRNPPKEVPVKKRVLERKPINEITPEEISEILRELHWSVAEISAYLHISDYKVYSWTAGHSLPNRSQTNKLRELQDKIRIRKFDEIPVSVKEFSELKEKLQYSDYHLSILLKIPFTAVHSWTLGVGAPNLLDSKKIRSLHEQVVSGKFVDDTVLPRISAEKIIELRKRQHLSKKEFMRMMGIRSNTYERWARWKKGPTKAENEKLWILWEKPEPPLPRILTSKELLQCRKSSHLTQDKMAEMFSMNRQKLSRYELGICKIPFEFSEKVRKIFNISFENERPEK